jgi:hypothetical protein
MLKVKELRIRAPESYENKGTPFIGCVTCQDDEGNAININLRPASIAAIFAQLEAVLGVQAKSLAKQVEPALQDATQNANLLPFSTTAVIES